MARTGLILTATAYPFAGIVRSAISYFYAVDKTKQSTFLVYADPLLLTPLFLLILPTFFDVNGIWSVMGAVQFTLCITVCLIMLYMRKTRKNEKKA